MAPPSRSVSVTIKYAKPGTQPPVYLAGSFSSPPWVPQEMQRANSTDGEFVKEIEVEEGKEYQYKFRMGLGDWWVLSDENPIATDGSGNKNNLLSVPKSKQQDPEVEESKDSSFPELTHAKETPTSVSTERESTAIATPPITPVTPVASKTENQETTSSNQSESENMSLPVKSSSREPASSPPIDEISNHLQPHETDNLPGARTPDLAQVAAEVADSAANLDHGPPSPNIPDDEAGRIGYRRMSSTPIPEVSETAAEVADVAAKLDRNKPSKIEMPSPPLSLEDEDIYAPTPEHERVPLFPHECPGPKDKVVTSRRNSTRNSSSLGLSQMAADEEIDTNDPSLESFPTTREGVFETIRSLENRLPPDESPHGSPARSPVSARHSERLDLPSPSPRLLAHDRSPSLDAIHEEQELDISEQEPVLAETRKHQNSETSQSVFSTDKKAENESSDTTTKSHREDNRVLASLNPEGENDSVVSEAGAKEVESKPEANDNSPKTTQTAVGVSENPNGDKEISAASPADEVLEDPENESADTDSKAVEVEQSTAHIVPDKPNKEDSEQNSKRPRAPTITIQPAPSPPESPKHAATSPGESLNIVRQPVSTPFFKGDNKQLGHDSEQNPELLSDNQGPSITIQPATPRTSLGTVGTDASEVETDVGESTSIAASGGNSDVASRKKQRAMTPSPDRPLTPSSIRSNKDVKSRNFLKAFWRVVFVDWIGGLIARCFGGRDSLVVVSAIVIAVVVPALYFYTSTSLTLRQQPQVESRDL